MDKVCVKFYSDKVWMCGETYESLVWKDTEKPTEDKMNELYELILVDEMREKRNKLLAETDFKILPDYGTDKDLWIDYRQKLRDLHSIWVKDIEFRTPP